MDSGANVTLGTSTTSASLSYSGPDAASNRNITLLAAGAIDVTSASTKLTLNGTIGGSGSLMKQGAGKLILAGSNDFSGGLTVVAGSVVVVTPNALRSGSPLTVIGGSTIFNAAQFADRGAPPQSSATAVPEPSSIAFVVTVGMCLLLVITESKRNLSAKFATISQSANIAE